MRSDNEFIHRLGWSRMRGKYQYLISICYLYVFFLLTVLSVFEARADQFEDVIIYVGVNGSDQENGREVNRPIKTSARLLQLIDEIPPSEKKTRLRVYFLRGTYRAMGIEWSINRENMLVFIESAPGLGRSDVVFDGTGGKLKQFFKYAPSGERSSGSSDAIRFSLSGFIIRNYCEGVSIGDIKGDFRTEGHVLKNLKFENIGSKYDSRSRRDRRGEMLPLGDCSAAVRFSATSNSLLQDSSFVNIENIPSSLTYFRKYGPGLLHSVYISGGSVWNKIVSNSFERFSGSPVRIRNASNNTSIVRNRFQTPLAIKGLTDKTPFFAVSEWYCNAALQVCMDLAEQGHQECPSKDTVMSENYLGDGVELYSDVSQSNVPTCQQRKD